MSASVSERRNTRATASAAPKLNARYSRVPSGKMTPLAYGTKETEKDVQLATSSYSAASGRGVSNGSSLSSARRSLVHTGTASSSSPTTQHEPKVGRSSSLTGGAVCSSSLCVTSARERATTAPLQRIKSATCTEKRRKYVVGTMRHCGSIYEEMAKQLLATGRWSHLSVRQCSVTKALVISETQKELCDTNMHLLLGEKLPCERVIATRRFMSKRYPSRLGERTNARRSAYDLRSHTSPGLRMPMGSGDDGEVRVVDFVENTRSITLKSSMVTALLKHHNYNWNTLGDYLPMSFKLTPCQSSRDERQQLLATLKGRMRPLHEGDEPCLWIAKSSAGCHGDNIEIFRGDYRGILKLLRFIDSQHGSQPWIAQQYVDRPLLYHKRKFDIRCWALLLRDMYEIYVHEELVMRTSSVPYNRESATSKTPTGRLAHITNHCVQETSKMYSLYEESNELWREHLDGLIRYKGTVRAAKLKQEKYTPLCSPRPQEPNRGDVPYPTRYSNDSRESLYPIREAYRGDSTTAPRFVSVRDEPTTITLDNHVMPQIHFIIRDSLLAARSHVPGEPAIPPTHTFQVFGYDFLIDENLKVWLLEINGAPGGPDRLKPALVKDTIELAVAPYFPGTMNLKAKRHNGYVRVYP
ncbi:tubulin-tyrosine_ligase-like_protein [Leishmania major strain Friedlin]|uniref:Tubulin--tyrosine ligase n=2 Tax=Leishmania major TaxID=5664 RepID=Q9U1E3_LEIMA|nr:putative tubulin-tyrosine ligase [Leishmania major]CAG9580432.1 tubulin-tyrosine_ligase-like_protein [Leishmania major strain Friedlin]